MIKKLLTIESFQFNPHQNLALEEALFDFVDDQTLIFYLWQNQHTVVIGKNQNAIKECRINELHHDDGVLARRLSGGGAVYHDLGNLNFTFLMSTDNFDVVKQSSVLLQALKKLGIEAYSHGRNDLLVDGKKFSGHAYYHHNGKSYHHGTLMVNVDFEKLSKYLNVSRKKLEGKGVQSVVSRVTNLIEYNSNLTIEQLKVALLESIEEIYHLKAQQLKLEDVKNIDELTKKYGHQQWLINPEFKASFETSERFDWGEISILLQIQENKVQSVEIYSDAMDVSLIECLKNALVDEIFSEFSLIKAVESCTIEPTIMQDIQSLFIVKDNPFTD